MTEYTPTEPEIAAELRRLKEFMAEPGAAPYRLELDPRAEGTTLAVVGAILGLVDEPGFEPAERIRAARAALIARRRWEQETKAA